MFTVQHHAVIRCSRRPMALRHMQRSSNGCLVNQWTVARNPSQQASNGGAIPQRVEISGAHETPPRSPPGKSADCCSGRMVAPASAQRGKTRCGGSFNLSPLTIRLIRSHPRRHAGHWLFCSLPFLFQIIIKNCSLHFHGLFRRWSRPCVFHALVCPLAPLSSALLPWSFPPLFDYRVTGSPQQDGAIRSQITPQPVSLVCRPPSRPEP